METDVIKKPSKVIHIKPYSTKDLAAIYGISPRTMNRWIEPMREEVGKKRGRYYTVKQVRLIFEEIGLPGFFEYN